MTEFLILIRNVVLAAILAWIGIDYAPQGPDKSPDDKPEGSVTVSILP